MTEMMFQDILWSKTIIRKTQAFLKIAHKLEQEPKTI